MIELINSYQDNFEAQELIRLINYTNQSVFLTGKAGTGKSTLLKRVTENIKKPHVVLASTGVAALNVGGQTIHSFLLIEPRPYLPNDPEVSEFSNDKKALLKKIELIIIDEVSMVRSDLMQAIDLTLRKNLKSTQPFAGKQLLLIGDLFQLPPVVNNRKPLEGEIIEHNYDSRYFFSAPSISGTYSYHVLELQKVYRQRSDEFIKVLNAVRTNSITNSHLSILNQRHIPAYQPHPDQFEITLGTTNDNVNLINYNNLIALPGTEKLFWASLTGSFLEEQEKNYPAEKVLKIKTRAQVMMIKNDQNGRWVNGSLGRITGINENYINIEIEDDEQSHIVEKYKWENVEYEWDRKENRIKKTVTGTFSQFPIKLAWAVTIHKSQGKTFDNIILDLERGAFETGQTYVALSRCRTLEGIKLRRQITYGDIKCDPKITTYLQSKLTEEMEKQRYQSIVAGMQDHIATLEASRQPVDNSAPIKAELEKVKARLAQVESEKISLSKQLDAANTANQQLEAKKNTLERSNRELQKKVDQLKNITSSIHQTTSISNNEMQWRSKVGKLQKTVGILVASMIVLITIFVLIVINAAYKI